MHRKLWMQQYTHTYIYFSKCLYEGMCLNVLEAVAVAAVCDHKWPRDAQGRTRGRKNRTKQPKIFQK